MRLVQSVFAGTRVLTGLGKDARRSCVQALHISSDRLSRQRSRLLNAGGLSQRQTWASRFSSALALRLRPTVEPSLIHAAVNFSRPWRTLAGCESDPTLICIPGAVHGGGAEALPATTGCAYQR